jgi:SAM-dependent methyltransferase
VRWGNLRRLQPFSAHFGIERGTPVDRYYLEGFFGTYRDDIAGRVLEVKDAEFSGRFGHDITTLDLVDIDPANDTASIIADLADMGSLPANAFDCVLMPQTLQFVDDVDVTIANAWQSLTSGGVLLVTVPGIQARERAFIDSDRWRFMPAGLEALLRRTCPDAEITVSGYGNLLAASAFLQGIAAEELTTAELEANDPQYPILSCGRARRLVE